MSIQTKTGRIACDLDGCDETRFMPEDETTPPGTWQWQWQYDGDIRIHPSLDFCCHVCAGTWEQSDEAQQLQTIIASIRRDHPGASAIVNRHTGSYRLT
jgi:hypothetical protein